MGSIPPIGYTITEQPDPLQPKGSWYFYRPNDDEGTEHGPYLTMEKAVRAAIKDSKLETVKIVVTDLQYDGGSLCANGCWRKEFTATASTRRGAIRKALAQYGWGWRKNGWASNDESWKLGGAMIGAYVEEIH